MSKLAKRLIRWHPVLSLAALVVALAAVAGSGSQTSSLTVDDITVRHVHVLDAEGRERVTIAGEFGPRRAELAGLLFHNEEGTEAGGLVYHGRRKPDGQIEAGGILTFDQYRNDQIMALEYEHDGGKKRNGITFIDRPDALSARVVAFYRAMEAAKSEEEREKIKRDMLPAVPRQELWARRLFVGRSIEGASLVSLCDATGRPRLNLEVDEQGVARIAFLDASGKTVRTITP